MAHAARLPCAALLRAAAQLMAESGYAAMSMRQLASRVGVLPGSLYHHVACKQDLLLNVLVDIVECRIQAWESSSSTADLNGFVRFLLHRQATHPHEHTLLVHEVRHLDSAQRHWLEQALDRLCMPLKRILEHAHGYRHRPGEARSACAAILSIIEAAHAMQGRLEQRWIEEQVLRMCQALLQPRIRA